MSAFSINSTTNQNKYIRLAEDSHSAAVSKHDLNLLSSLATATLNTKKKEVDVIESKICELRNKKIELRIRMKESSCSSQISYTEHIERLELQLIETSSLISMLKLKMSNIISNNAPVSAPSTSKRAREDNSDLNSQHQLSESELKNLKLLSLEPLINLISLENARGVKEAEFELASRFFEGRDLPINVEKGVNFLKRSAKKGYAPAQTDLGLCFLRGHGVAQNHEQALNWFDKAAEQEYAPGLYELGKCLFIGIGIDKCETDAAECFKLAAEKGHKPAQYQLGRCYIFGRGVEKNEPLGRKLIQESGLMQGK